MKKTEKYQPVVAIATGGVADESAPDGVINQLQNLKAHHHWDLNMPDDIAEEVDEALKTSDKGTREHLAQEPLENSPYPEVRTAVSNMDEGGHSNTIRAWTIGLLFATIGSALNMLFSMRQPYITIPSYIAHVVADPAGKAWDKFQKEHAIIVIMANATFGGGVAYATDVLLAQRAFYGQKFGWIFEIFMCISTQMLGFGLAGFFTRFLVSPAAMIWPSTLINTALFSALHDHSKPDPRNVSGWKIGRYRVFLYTMIGSFCWYWFPGYIAPFLSVFAWVTWIKPQSVVMNQLFGGWTGLSLIPITFDWAQISGFNFSPLIAPWYGIANTLIGMVIFYWIVTPAIHFSGLFYGKYLPMSDSNSYDNTGAVYNVSKILTSDFTFDVAKYKNYSPLFLSTTFTLCYGLSFGGIIAVLIHAGLFHGPDIWARFRRVGQETEDVHSRLMSRFKPVPLWWYASVALIMVVIGLGVTQAFPTHLSWCAFFISLIISIVWIVPIGIIKASTNIDIGLNVITEFIIGYMQPGCPMAMVLFKTYGYISMSQGVYFLQDLKLGHYMKVPPRVTFAAQMASWALGSIKDVCQQHQANHYSCPNGRVFFNASVIWGVIGPARMFSISQMYSPLMFFWLAGALLPITIYFGARIFPRSSIKFLSAPLIFSGAGLIPPATPLNYLSWGIYNYVLSADLDVGLAVCTLVIFLTLNLTNTSFPEWWGMSIATNTMDAAGTAVQAVLPEGEKFGPKTW
ncbi:Sexual differentiation process protein isp4 [Penicillium capsulatum]|nr:Sexual differentiation process protein isp4 [Penicillium capsulatum]